MKSKTIWEQNPSLSTLLQSGPSWGGLPFTHTYSPSIPFIRSGTADRPRLIVTTEGHSEISWSTGRNSLKGVWDVGSISFTDRDFELENLVIDGELSDLNLDLDEHTIEHWTGDDLAADALLSRHLPRHIVSVDHHVLALMRGIEAEIRNGCPSGLLYAESISIATISYLWGRFAKPHSVRRLQGLSPSRLKLLKEYIKTHIQNDVSLIALADMAGLSPRHLRRCFKQATGESPYQYQLNMRINEAKQLLRKGDLSITETALSLGFSTPSHFSTSFSKVVGVSPREFRLHVK